MKGNENIFRLLRVEEQCGCGEKYFVTLEELFLVLDKHCKITQKEVGGRKYAIQLLNHLAYLLSCE